MPTTPIDKRTREQLEADAAEMSARLDAIRQEENRRHLEAQQRADQAREQYDRELIAALDRRALDREVNEARAALDQALRDSPLVQAFAAYQTAAHRRVLLMAEKGNAYGRLGQPPVDTSVEGLVEMTGINIAEMIAQAVTRTSADAAYAEVADLNARRDAAADSAG